jgi:hypothetical protein
MIYRKSTFPVFSTRAAYLTIVHTFKQHISIADFVKPTYNIAFPTGLLICHCPVLHMIPIFIAYSANMSDMASSLFFMILLAGLASALLENLPQCGVRSSHH